MNAFHPALTGVLYDALAQHEQAFAQMAIAALHGQVNVYDDETVERYVAIIDGLKRMIDMTKPAQDASTSGFEHNEKMRRAYVVLGQLISQLSDFDIWSWDINRYRGICGSLNCPDGTDPRPMLREIAERLGFEFAERPHGSSTSTVCIEAKGEIDGLEVRVYELVQAERPFCDTHHVMVDDAGVCPECSILHALMPDGTEIPRCGADVNSLIALFAENVTCPECKSRLAAQLAEENDPDDPDDNGLDRYTDDQMAGMACAGCGVGFGAEPRVRVGHTFPGGGVVTDLGLSAHPDCIDSTIPELGDAP